MEVTSNLAFPVARILQHPAHCFDSSTIVFAVQLAVALHDGHAYSMLPLCGGAEIIKSLFSAELRTSFAQVRHGHQGWSKGTLPHKSFIPLQVTSWCCVRFQSLYLHVCMPLLFLM